MKYKKGDKVKIIAKSNDHGFNIGEVVTIDEVRETSYKASNEEDY